MIKEITLASLLAIGAHAGISHAGQEVYQPVKRASLYSLPPEQRCERLYEILSKPAPTDEEKKLIQHNFPITIEEARNFLTSKDTEFVKKVDEYSFYKYKTSKREWDTAVTPNSVYIASGEIKEIVNKGFGIVKPYDVVIRVDGRGNIIGAMYTCWDEFRKIFETLFKKKPETKTIRK